MEEHFRQATAPATTVFTAAAVFTAVFTAMSVLDAMKTVPLSVSPWLEVRRRAARFALQLLVVSRVFHGRDEVSEQNLTRRRLDAVRAPMQIVESGREEAVLDGLDERVGLCVFAVAFSINIRIQS